MMNHRSDFAVILLAHGTREPEASSPVHRYARALAKRTTLRVEPCLREFIEPSVPTVVKKLKDEGIRNIFVLPFFLFKSGHVTRDIQEDVKAEQEKHPEIKFQIGEPLGEDSLLEELLEKRLSEGQLI
jgi:sirohydrochlorin ferrochelatase